MDIWPSQYIVDRIMIFLYGRLDTWLAYSHMVDSQAVSSSIIAPGIMAFSIMAPSIMTLSKMALDSVILLSVANKLNAVMLYVVRLNVVAPLYLLNVYRQNGFWPKDVQWSWKIVLLVLISKLARFELIPCKAQLTRTQLYLFAQGNHYSRDDIL